MASICGIDCAKCTASGDCSGCLETNGRPFGAACVVAVCCRKGTLCEMKERLLAAFNALSLPDMPEVTELYPLKGSVVNLAYTLPGGQSVKFWDDNGIYWGTQLPKRGSGRCYGLAADEAYLMVAEYGEGGAGAEVVVYKRWN